MGEGKAGNSGYLHSVLRGGIRAGQDCVFNSSAGRKEEFLFEFLATPSKRYWASPEHFRKATSDVKTCHTVQGITLHARTLMQSVAPSLPTWSKLHFDPLGS